MKLINIVHNTKLYVNKLLPKIFTEMLIYSMDTIHDRYLDQRKYTCTKSNKNDVLNEIIAKIKSVIDSDSETKKHDIMVLESEYSSCNLPIVGLDINDEIVKHNYDVFMKQMNKQINVDVVVTKSISDTQSFTPMHIMTEPEYRSSKLD